VVEAFSPETREFTIAGPVSDISNSAPFLVASVPENDATDVPVDSVIALRFSKLLAPRTVNPETVVLNSSEGHSYAKVVASENGRLVFVSPLEPLEPNTSYTLTFNRASDGVNVVVPASISFTTQVGDADVTLQIAPAALDPSTLNVYDFETLLPGSVNTQVKVLTSTSCGGSLDQSVGQITVSPVVFDGGDNPNFKNTSFHALATGSTVVYVPSSAGYARASNLNCVTANVN